MQPLSEALKVNQTLTNLNLECSWIDDEGMQALSESLKVNQTLTDLKLSDNPIENEGMNSLSEALKINRTLTQLDLSKNPMNYDELEKDQEKIVEEFIQSLTINKSIINLSIHGNRINEKDNLSKIENLIKRNLIFQERLTKSAKVGDFKEFQKLIQTEKIPLIYQQFDDDVINRSNNQEENTIFHIAIFHNQTGFLFHLLFANNEKTDQEIISKRNFLLKIKNLQTKKSVIDFLNTNEILI
ncbi:leucine rich repeat family protein [Anaeramoeba flamelloides]|uniref:Leucine rich repeat family protein n=1 Tax=Anaeramoeba flamelloides TaxID=1746091 RepID=A0AAV7YIU3_9EUKA|nr:leucine rich repeat family protein [Anaeramoeba flamelloides]